MLCDEDIEIYILSNVCLGYIQSNIYIYIYYTYSKRRRNFSILGRRHKQSDTEIDTETDRQIKNNIYYIVIRYQLLKIKNLLVCVIIRYMRINNLYTNC